MPPILDEPAPISLDELPRAMDSDLSPGDTSNTWILSLSKPTQCRCSPNRDHLLYSCVDNPEPEHCQVDFGPRARYSIGIVCLVRAFGDRPWVLLRPLPTASLVCESRLWLAPDFHDKPCRTITLRILQLQTLDPDGSSSCFSRYRQGDGLGATPLPRASTASLVPHLVLHGYHAHYLAIHSRGAPPRCQ